MIKNWWKSNAQTSHPRDNESFFDIVKKDRKISCEMFSDALKEVDEHVDENLIDENYKNYELLHDFMHYCQRD